MLRGRDWDACCVGRAESVAAGQPALVSGCRYDPDTGLLHATPNWNLVNLTLQLLGPCNELWLCLRLLTFQIACCIGAFALRNILAGIYK